MKRQSTLEKIELVKRLNFLERKAQTKFKVG
jgi:hypothetical protein